MSSFWSGYIVILSVGNILALWWLLRWTAKPRPGEAAANESTGHVWDENLEELNNPMPRWWLWMFYLSIIFALGYLLLFPGLGSFKGLLGWTATGAYEAEVARAEEHYAPLYASYAAREVEDLAQDPEAMQTAHRLFANSCAVCHGSDGRGSPGFPNLTDNDWLYGGTPEAIRHSILNGRRGVMPPLGGVLSEREVNAVTAYAYSLNGRAASDDLIRVGEQVFAQHCAVCHSVDGTGNQALGAPDLTSDSWLYGGSLQAIRTTVMEGRSGEMPAHKELLGEDRVHLLTAYVYSLSRDVNETREASQ